MNTDKYRRNRTGEIYQFLFITNMEATEPGWQSVVVFMDDDGKKWSKSVHLFKEEFTKLGEK